MFPAQADLIGWRDIIVPELEAWEPRPLDIDEWNSRNYDAVYLWRIETLKRFRLKPETLASAKIYYSTRPMEFIIHWMDTYDPRRPDKKWIPFILFRKQAEFITFLHELRQDGESGLVEKARDMGVTWEACAYSIWSWLFIDNDAIGWGSRKQELVDKIGDVSSIFEKMRMLLRHLPNVFLPAGLKPRDHLTFMKMINPENGATITGETGDNIGRGGRTAMYFKDESAHYERPEKIEAALGDNTNVQVDISSVNGLGNPFHRRRQAGVDWQPDCVIPKGFVRVFVMDWRDHPDKTQEWYDLKRAKSEREGTLHLFAQEVDRNYSAAISNTLIDMQWIEAAVNAHQTIPYLAALGPPSNVWMAGLDVADGGIDRNALALRQWIIWRDVQEWGERDTGTTTRRAIQAVRGIRDIEIQFDSIGVGAGVKAEYNRLCDSPEFNDGKLPLPRLVPWNAGGKVLFPHERLIPDDDDSILNGDMFYNLKAQAWWAIRTRFYKTWQAVKYGVIYTPDELISLDGAMALLPQLKQELNQVTRGDSSSLKTLINKTPDGTKSPNLADAGIMMFYPMPKDFGLVVQGRTGG